MPISHLCTALEGREWKKVFLYRSIINAWPVSYTNQERFERNSVYHWSIEETLPSFHSLPSNSVHRCEIGIT